MNLEIIGNLNETIKDAIVSYVDLVKDDFIPDFFKDEDEILKLLSDNIKEVLICTSLRERGSSYTFEKKRLWLGSDYTKSIIIHELHHIVQSAYAAKTLKENSVNYTDEIIVQKVNAFYVKYDAFFEAMAYYWENKFREKEENEKLTSFDPFYPNSLIAINRFIEMWGFKKIFEFDLKCILGISHFFGYSRVYLFEQVFNLLKAISNVNSRIFFMEAEKDSPLDKKYYTPDYGEDCKYDDDDILNNMKIEKQKLIDAITLLLGITGWK